ncbi:adhesion G-protein coupled receptor G7-like [Paramisgurnus dabryanus]|uniref:adhesion G-protein coupled receptor G7-like n=1 Tax=Paramisgurnus dabryanus TaxID=90735 RepID=UPI0031F39237
MMHCCLILIFILAVFGRGWSQNNTKKIIKTVIIYKYKCIYGNLTSGTSCNNSFCPEGTTNTSGFTFPRTFLGQFASSKELCKSGPNAGIPKASALCNITTHVFNAPNILDCTITLDDIHANISGVSVEEKKSLASNTQILTSMPGLLTPLNITNAVNIANMLLSSETLESTDIAVSTVATVSQLLSASAEKFSHVSRDALSNLTQTLQNFSLREESNNLVQPNLAVQSFKGKNGTQQVQLTLFKGNDTFTPRRIKLDSNMTHFSSEVDIQMNITFSKGMDKDVGFVLYDSDLFFPSQSFKPSLNTKRRVFSANLFKNGSGTMEVQFSVTPSHDPTMSLNDFACVFWSYSEKDWSTKGCTKTKSFSGHTQCSCRFEHEENQHEENFENNNLNKNFAVLMSININFQYSEELHWISIAGCTLSILGLAVTAVYQIATRKSRGCSPTLLLVNICLSMMIFYLLFIFGINNPVVHAKVSKVAAENRIPVSDYHRYSDEGPCTAFTALIHYFLLATFTWNTLYGINVFLIFKTTTISGTPPWFPKVSIAVGWGFPAIIVGLSLGFTYRVDDPLGYRQEEFCWLAFLDPKHNFSLRKPMFWAFLLPLGIMLFSNMAILLHFSLNICKTKPNLNSSRQTPLKKKILSSFSLAVMLSLMWFTGYILLFTHEPTLHCTLSIVFCVCNTTQGIQIFILFTLRSVIKSYPAILKAMNAPNIGIHRKVVLLWKVKAKENNETYRPTDPDSTGKP